MEALFEGIETAEEAAAKSQKKAKKRPVLSDKSEVFGKVAGAKKFAAPAPPKKRKVGRPKKSVSSSVGSAKLLPARRDDPLYNLLRAYAKNKTLAPLLAREGVVLDPHRLRMMSKSQLEGLLLETEEALDASMSGSVVDTSAQALMQFLENLVQARTAYKPQGLTQTLFNDPSWLALYERVKLRAGVGVTPSDPALELLVKTLQAGQAVHMQNVMQDHGVNLNEPPADQSKKK